MIFKSYMKLANVKELFLKNQLQLLKEVIKASVINFPFQNISSMGAFLPRERKTPNLGDFLAACIRGEGGLCGHLNNHMRFQLESLGYQTKLHSGCFVRTGVPNSHFMTTVRIPHYTDNSIGTTPLDLRRDKYYLVDVGCGLPIHEPIDLEELPFVRRAGGLQYRYERVNDTTIRRVNECGDPILGEKPSSYNSPQDYSIDLSPRQFGDFYPAVHIVYSCPQNFYLHRGMYCFRYLDIIDDDFEIVCAYGTDLIFITKETRHVQKFENYEHLKPSLLKYFPMINPTSVELTVKHFSIPFEEALQMSSVNSKQTQSM